MASVAVGDVEIEYTDTGSGPVVVFVHGAYVTGALWDDVVRRPAIFGGFLASAAVRREAARFTADLKPSHTMAAANALKQWDKPVLMAWGTSDKTFPLSHAQRLAETFPNAVVHTVEDSSTYVMLDRPDETAEAIRRFVNGSSGEVAQ